MLTSFKKSTYSQLHSQHLLQIAEGNTPDIDGDTHNQLLELLSKDGISEASPDFHQRYLHKYAHYCLADRHAANPNCQADPSGETPLIKAAARGNVKLMELLVTYKAGIHHIDDEGNSALHVACLTGNKEAVAFLLKNQASVISQNLAGQFPIHHAVRFPEIVSALLQQESPINPLCDEGKNPLHYAVELNAPIDTFNILIQHGANFMHKDCQHKTPLQVGSSSVYLHSIGCDSSLQALEQTVTIKAKALSSDAKQQFLLNLFTENTVDLPAEIYQLILENVSYEDFVSAAQEDPACKALAQDFSKMGI